MTRPDRPATPLERIVGIVLVASAATVFLAALLIIASMSRSETSQGTPFFVATAAVIALAALEAQLGRLRHRFRPFHIGTSASERNYVIVSAIILIAAAVVLFGFAYLAFQN